MRHHENAPQLPTATTDYLVAAYVTAHGKDNSYGVTPP